MKKPILFVVVIVIIGLVIWGVTRDKDARPDEGNTDITSTSTPSASAVVSETTKVSDKLSEYKNEELGFAVKYPSTWATIPSETGVTFAISTGKSDTNTIGKLESKIGIISGKCSFPPVTTVKERTTLKSGDLSFNMISMSNSVQGRAYFDRMYSLQRDNICYILSLSSITLNPSSKGFKGSEATQMANNNKALVDAADQAFIAMTKSFSYVIGVAGKDETQVVPTKK
ncbi:MAG: hypothetical protein AAB917_02850 [Patescibacteria group bacterium]